LFLILKVYEERRRIWSWILTPSPCLGFDEVGLALVFAVLPFMGMLAKPLAGWLADRFSLQKTIFMASIVLSGTRYLTAVI
jgi:hypothetical protein